MIDRLNKLLGFSKRPAAALAQLPIELKPGGIYVIEAHAEMTPDSFQDLSRYLETFNKQTGCRFLVLDEGYKIGAIKASQE